MGWLGWEEGVTSASVSFALRALSWLRKLDSLTGLARFPLWYALPMACQKRWSKQLKFALDDFPLYTGIEKIQTQLRLGKQVERVRGRWIEINKRESEKPPRRDRDRKGKNKIYKGTAKQQQGKWKTTEDFLMWAAVSKGEKRRATESWQRCKDGEILRWRAGEGDNELRSDQDRETGRQPDR